MGDNRQAKDQYMQIDFVPDHGPTDGAGAALAVIAFDEAELSAPAQAADAASGGAVTKALAATRFKGGKSQVLDLIAPGALDAARLLVIGAGPKGPLDEQGAEMAAGAAYQAVKASGLTRLVLRFPDLTPALAARAALGVRLASYRFDKYLTKEKPERKPSIDKVEITVSDPAGARAAFQEAEALADAVAFSRDLVSEPANILYPVEFARRVKELERLGLEVEILGVKEMETLGMGALLGVGQGSSRESQLAVIQWKGASDPAAQPIAFVGKGVCFDTG
ncbi:MAG: M17 family peptidase N-terminal domain-containing protein, partial [Caulobacteraceae bacterium]